MDSETWDKAKEHLNSQLDYIVAEFLTVRHPLLNWQTENELDNLVHEVMEERNKISFKQEWGEDGEEDKDKDTKGDEDEEDKGDD